jgi:hypothetical protein
MTKYLWYLQIEPLHILLSPGLVYEVGPSNPHMRNELTFSPLARRKQAYSFVCKDLTFVPAPEVDTVSSPCCGSSELFHVDA